MKKLVFKFDDKLNPGDTELTTFGCRQNNPDICSLNGLENVCAFVCEDCICKKPSRKWKKQFDILKQMEKETKNETN